MITITIQPDAVRGVTRYVGSAIVGGGEDCRRSALIVELTDEQVARSQALPIISMLAIQAVLDRPALANLFVKSEGLAAVVMKSSLLLELLEGRR